MKRGKIVTLGSFDGVHRGHQELLAVTLREAKKRGYRSTAVAFRIPPRMILDAGRKIALLSTAEEKARLFRNFGIDDARLLTFDRKLAAIRPFNFLRDVLIRQIGARGLVVGADFRFGTNRSAGALELVRWGQEFEIPVWVVPPVKWRRTTVSSSLIRRLLEEGAFRSALQFLGHPYLIEGKVVRGKGFGRRLGFPTANLSVAPGKILPEGVYAIRGGLSSGSRPRVWDGVCNIGRRPTVDHLGAVSVEAHFFAHPGQLRGKTVWIELLHRLRGEKRFAHVDALKRAISDDIRRARRRLKR